MTDVPQLCIYTSTVRTTLYRNLLRRRLAATVSRPYSR